MLFYGFLYLFVPQAIDNGIEEGREDSKGQSNGSVPEQGVGGREAKIHESHTTKEEQKDRKVGDARGKCFAAAFS